jgi:hypothetical protein
MTSSICPIFDEQKRFIGLWAQNENFFPSFGSLAELASLAEPTLQALTKLPQRRISNNSIEVGNGVRFEKGAFIMINNEKAPNEELTSPESENAYVLVDYLGIACLERCKRTDPRMKTPPTIVLQTTQQTINADINSTDWYKNQSKRGGSTRPSDFNLLEIPCYSKQKWVQLVSHDPIHTKCTVCPITKLSGVVRSLNDFLKKDHNLTSSEIVTLFDEYLMAACPKCFGGLTGNMLQTVSAFSQLKGAIGAGQQFQRILSGRCATCDSDTYYIVWLGDRAAPSKVCAEKVVSHVETPEKTEVE